MNNEGVFAGKGDLIEVFQWVKGFNKGNIDKKRLDISIDEENIR